MLAGPRGCSSLVRQVCRNLCVTPFATLCQQRAWRGEARRPHGSARAASLGNSGFSGWRGSQRPLICKGGDEPPSSCDYLLPNHSASTLDRLQWWPFTAWTFHSADPQTRCKKARFSLPLCGISSNRLRNGCCCRSSRHVSEATRVGCMTRQFCQRG